MDGRYVLLHGVHMSAVCSQCVNRAQNLTLVQIPESGWFDLFTDGSCHGPRVPWRLASWAVVMADPHDIGLMGQGSVVPNASPLKGLTQTAFRAEVRAALEALRIGAMLKCKVRIWCDCQGVVERVTAQPRSETNQAEW